MKGARLFRSPVAAVITSFAGVIALGCALLCLPACARGTPLPALDALFTAVSATCVTGLSVVDVAARLTPLGQVVLLAMIQVGGLGLVAFVTFFNLLLRRRLPFSSMQQASENSGFAGPAQAGRLLRMVMGVTFAAEGLGFVLLCAAFVPRYGALGLWHSLFIAVSAFCNAGFDLFGGPQGFISLTGFAGQPYVLGVVAALIVCGGLGFAVWSDLLLPPRRGLGLHARLVLLMSAGLILGGAGAFAALEWNNPATLGGLCVGDRLINSLFQSVSTRTAGFCTLPLEKCRGLTKLLMSGLMFIGAAPGGTGGGVKVTTVAVVLATVYSVLRGRQQASLWGWRIRTSAVYRALSVLLLGALALAAGIPLLYYGAGRMPGVDCLFEGVSAFATVGLTVGVTAAMGPLAKVAAMLMMFAGRLGPVTFAWLFIRRQRADGGAGVLPEGHILVG